MGVFDKIQFEVLPEHIKLIENMYFEYSDWAEFGAPIVDPKRPYGNSDVYYDIGELLEIEPEEDDDDYKEFSEEQMAYMNRLHQETATVLQIIVSTKSFEPGLYECEQYSIKWERVKT